MTPGLYIHLKACGHTYGIQCYGDKDLYREMKTLYATDPMCKKHFLQGDDSKTSWLFIEFLGERHDDDTAVALCEEFAKKLRTQIIDFI